MLACSRLTPPYYLWHLGAFFLLMLAVYSPLAFLFLFLLAPPDAGLLPYDVSKVTLPAWPGQGMDALGYLQDS